MNKEHTLRPHQQRFLDENPKRVFLVHAMRTGKSLIGELWTKHPSRNRLPIVVCTKRNKQEWVARCPHAKVYTKEEFKKHIADIIMLNPSCILIDEAHHFFSPLFMKKKRSQMSEALFTFFKHHQDIDRMLSSGTPLTNDPASLHSALFFLGHYQMKWEEFRDEFYALVRRPFNPYPFYEPVKGWRVMANDILSQHADIVSLRDVVAELPEVIEEVVNIETPTKMYAQDEDQTWISDHRHEQTEKWKWIREYGEENRKLIVVCHYIEQMEELAKKLKDQKPVFVVNGRTKNQEQVIKEAQESPDAYLLVQSAMGEGYDAYMFDAMIFASMPHRVLFYEQMRARLDTVERSLMKPKVYITLLGGMWDRRIYRSVKDGFDFSIHNYKGAIL